MKPASYGQAKNKLGQIWITYRVAAWLLVIIPVVCSSCSDEDVPANFHRLYRRRCQNCSWTVLTGGNWQPIRSAPPSLLL
ncbi:hypothetical protein FB451DRAFT_1274492 [Mycena latifolia]|nr:hypothetical protein FB451DRAFT_1274492 [Mycena latifolia]